MDNHLADTQVAVLAGGLGTRIAKVLGDTPKLLAEVDGRPYLAYFIDWMRSFGVRRVTFCLGHLAGAIVGYLEQHPQGIEVDWVIEPKPMGTAGALRFARTALKTDPVLICNGDSFTDADLGALLAEHRRQGAAGTVLCTRVDETFRFGRVEISPSGRICRFSEKGIAGSGYINAGVYVVSAALLDDIARGDATSLENDVFARLPPDTLAAYAGDFRFIDIGTPESLREAKAGMLRRA